MSFVALVFIGLSLAGYAHVIPDGPRFLLLLISLVWIPGHAIFRLLVSGDAPVRAVPAVSFAIGVAVHGVLYLLCTLIGAGFGAFSVAAHALPMVILVASVVWRPVVWAKPRWKWGGVAVLCTVALVQMGPFGFEQDAYDHIGYIRHIAESGQIQPRGVLASDFQAPVLPADPRKGALHAVLAMVCNTAAIDPFVAWQWLPVLMFPLSVFAFAAFASVFTGSTAALAVCMGLFLLSYSGVGILYAGETVYGQNLAVFWMWILSAIVVGAHAKRPRLILVAMVAFAGATVHAGVVLHAAVLGATLLLFRGWVCPGRTDGWRFAGALAVGVALPAAVRVVDAGGANYLHMHVQGVMYLAGKWFVLSPFEVLRQHGLLFLGGLALLPVSGLLARGDALARRQVAFAALPLVICFAPLVATTLFHRATYMVFRSLLAVPVYPIIALVWVASVTFARKRGVGVRLAVCAALCIWTLGFVWPGVRASVAAMPRVFSERRNVSENMQALIDYARALPAGTVIASDPRTSYALSAATTHAFVAINGQHANPYDTNAMHRLADLETILSPYSSPHDVLTACERWNVDVVILNAFSPIRTTDYLALWDSARWREVGARLVDIRGRFRVLHEIRSVDGATGALALIHERAGLGEGAAGSSEPPLIEGTGTTRCVVPGVGGDWNVQSLDVVPGRLVPGESAEVLVGYARMGQVTFGLPVIMHLRLDATSIADAPDYPLAKHVRRWRERSRGEWTRLRIDHHPFGAAFPIRHWPIGRDFIETFSIQVPVWMAAGNYRIELNVREQPVLPNFHIRDVLFNRDSYSGQSCGSVTFVDESVGAR